MIDPPDLSAVVAAPFFGSFVGVLADRLPRCDSIVLGRSKCRGCERLLAPRELIPIVSWTLQRGRCRSCGIRIDPMLPIVEIGALGIAIWASTVFTGWLLWASCGLGWILLALAAIDARFQILPDVLTLSLVPAGLGVLWLIEPGTLSRHVLAAAAGFAAFALIATLYWRLRGRDGLGMGDAKLLASAGAWIGFDGLPSVVIWASGTALTVTLLGLLAGRAVKANSRIAFGPYLCLGIWLVWLYGPFELS